MSKQSGLTYLTYGMFVCTNTYFEVIMKMYALKDTFWHKYFHPPPQSEKQEIINRFKK